MMNKGVADGWTNRWWVMSGWMDGWMIGSWMSGWLNEWMNGGTKTAHEKVRR
jgi:hypothetical protein